MEQIYLDYLARLLQIWIVVAILAASVLIFSKGLGKILDMDAGSFGMRLGTIYILISIFLMFAVVAIAR